ncbi:DHA2 family efflux MFS transporter permease subunit [Nocardioides seonyuensis]|uniref:DHA2 family efflux MFS transporter permease subunit n=1 Tax=Nocardioides seonyuensis TaxID=2518371 RepID=A0A4P7IE82_9ACTN|nr:DHA2 family efflux MFS transporter permease subunit [Nocardioides seonyuensis]QBX54287.1 DHA2 family efflux MFS transporter permease subunit [Nocardioides seonyuensis]
MTDTTATETTPLEPEVTPAEHRRLTWALVLISLAQLMVVLDSTIANIALPYIGGDLDIDDANLSWIVTAYALTFGGFLLLGGRLADLYGRRRVFMIGVLVFSAASLLGGMAQTELLLLSARGLQGLGAAMASPAALALITTTFPAGRERNRAFAIYAAMAGVGAAVGLILGGWLTGLDSPLGVAGWRYTFFVVVPIGIAAAVFAPKVLPESERHTGELDVPGAVTATAGLLSIVYGLTRAGQESYGWGDTWTITALVVGVALLALFLLIETRVVHPLMPFRVFANRNRATAFAVMMIVPAAMFAMFFFLSLFIQSIVGYSPLRTGFAFLPFSIAMIVSATLASKLISHVDPRFLSGVGTLMSATALFGFSRLSVPQDAAGILTSGRYLGDGVSYWTDVLPFVVLMALGMGLNFVPLTLVALHHLRAQDSGIGSGVLNTMQQVGGALGLAALSTVALHFSQDRAEEVGPQLAGAAAQGGTDLTPEVLAGLTRAAGFADGATQAFLTGAGMMLAASLLVWVFLDVKHEELATDGPQEVAPVH